MSGEDSPEIFRDNTQYEQDVNVSLMEAERSGEDDQQHDEDDQQHDEDKDYLQQHNEEPAYSPNVPVYNQYDALRRCTGCVNQLEYIGEEGEKECWNCGINNDEELLFCKKCVFSICNECHEEEMNLL